MKIIDAHVHLVQCIAGTGAGGEMRSIGGGRGQYADGSVCQVIPEEWNTDQVTPERVLEVMDAHEVERAVLLQAAIWASRTSTAMTPSRSTRTAFWRPPLTTLTAGTGTPSCTISLRNWASGWSNLR